MNNYDIIVIGGGHAGCEAALAGARLGCRTLLITMNADNIGLMSCNPAIGGLAKGQLVKEVDALGGWMGKATDATLIQFRRLNMSKGPAVRSSRAQVDRQAYRRYMKSAIEGQDNLTVKEAMIENLIVGKGRVEGVETSLKEAIYGRAIIITPGTFFNGLIHIGLDHFPGGRIGERPSSGLALRLKGLEVRMMRFKTGTCPRLDGKTIDFSRLREQKGDDSILPFSFETEKIRREQLSCYITYTNKKTHGIIRSNLDRSPLFSGVIKGTGVRYCPSIEDKVFRFPDRDSHHIFLEPEGMHTTEYYPNGISTSLPQDVQVEIVRSIEGLEKAEITRPGYGIEHDVIDSTQLYPTLELKSIEGLYFAGQINGTTGYEEAASQGLVAGINAALKVMKRPHMVLDRSKSYIGVLIDDLVTRGTNEPYRMFTSRVEYRLILREDNADIRLTPIGHEIGLVGEDRYKKVMEKQESIEREKGRLNTRQIQYLRRPGISYREMASLFEEAVTIAEDVIEEVEIDIKYDGFIQRQKQEVERFEKIERIKMPAAINYEDIHGLSKEIKEKLSRAKPVTLGQASRISGVTPASISILMVYLEKLRRTGHSPSYNDYNTYLKSRYGCRVYKIGLDAGFTCPNRDGTKSTGGCIYCNELGSRSSYTDPELSVRDQLRIRISYLKDRFEAKKFIAYFQAFSNTYAPPQELKSVYDEALEFDDIVGLSIGTRPDTMDRAKLELISSYKNRFEVWLEYGLQTIHDKTLARLNRCHTYKDFLDAVELTREFGIPVSAHVILGLPGESREDMLETAIELKRLKIDGVKIHMLHVLKGSRLEELYNRGEVRLLTQDEYAALVSDFIANLPPKTIIQRVTGEGPRGYHLAPEWALDKAGTIDKIKSSRYPQ